MKALLSSAAALAIVISFGATTHADAPATAQQGSDPGQVYPVKHHGKHHGHHGKHHGHHGKHHGHHHGHHKHHHKHHGGGGFWGPSGIWIDPYVAPYPGYYNAPSIQLWNW